MATNFSTRVIPAIDLIGGKCVRLSQGDYSSSKKYYDDPLEVAKLFEGAGIKRLHLVDLDGAKASFPLNLNVLERIASATSLELEFGGGIKSTEALKVVLEAGAKYVICGSIAVTDPELLDSMLAKYGESIILGVDCRNGRVATRGWLDTASLSASEVIGHYPSAKQAIVTDISRDGMLSGVDTNFYTKLQAEFPSVDIIVSGGISSAEDIKTLADLNLRGVIVGKAFYEGRISLEELSELASNARRSGKTNLSGKGFIPSPTSSHEGKTPKLC